MNITSFARLFESRRRRLGLFVAAVAILVVGAWLRPLRPQQAGDAAQEAPAPMLRTLVEEREPIRIFRALRARADEVASAVGRIDCEARPAPPAVPDWSGAPVRDVELPGFGVVIAPGEVLVDARGRENRRCELRLGPGQIEFDPLRSSEDGLAIVRAEGTPQAPRPAPGPPVPGQIVFSTGPAASGRVISPVFVVQVDGASITLSAQPAAVASGPLFDSDARLTGFLASDGRAFPISEAIERARRESPPAAQPVSLGVRTQPITEALRPFFGEDGIVISEVAADGPGAGVGLRPGDVLVAVGGRPVRSPGDLAERLSLAGPGPLELSARRGTRTRSVTVEAAVVPEPHEAGLRTRVPGERRLLPLDGIAVPRLRTPRGEAPPELLYVEEDGVRFFAVRSVPR